jgi:hypothetical protein
VHELEVGISLRGGEELFLAGGKIIPAGDSFSVGEQSVNQIAADKTCRAGDKNFFHD